MARHADVVVLTIGGRYGSCSIATMGEGVDTTDINLPACQDGFIREVAKLGKPLVGLHFSGRPLSSDTADQYLDAIVEVFSPAEKGAEAIVDVLTGRYNPSGKLTVSVPYHVGQIPLYFNHLWGSAWHQGESIGFAHYVNMPHTPRYSFGHGLSYTTFDYTELQIYQPDREQVVVTCQVTNTGTCEGTEVVQLYMPACQSSAVRTGQDFIGFHRVT